MYNNLGLVLVDLGKPHDALANYRQALEIKPDLVEAHYNLGNALRDLDKLVAAVASYRHALEIKPDYALAHHELGKALDKLGRLDKAVASFRQAVEIQPTLAEAHHDLGKTLERLGKFDKAVASYRQALEIKPGLVEAHYDLGNCLRQLGKLDEAIACYRRALELKSDFAAASSNLGFVLQDLGQFHDALASYRRALEIEPTLAEARFNEGSVLRQLGKPDEAVACYRQVLEIQPRFWRAHQSLGSVLLQLGQFDEAVASYRHALEIEPGLAELHNTLGSALLRFAKFDEAVVSFREALEIRSDYVEAHSNLGSALHRLGKVDEAVACQRRALEIRPDYIQAHVNLGIQMHDIGKPEEAIACYRQALEIEPDCVEAHANLADMLEKTNRIEALREAISNAKQSCPGHPLVAVREAQLLKRDGDYAAARRVLEEAGEPAAPANVLAARLFLLGELCDRLKDEQAAYNYFSEGNLRCRDSQNAKQSDAGLYLSRLEVLSKRYTADWIADWRPLEISDDRPDPVFLVGFPRSGTTLLDTILLSHNAITIVEEMPTIENLQRILLSLPGGDPDGLAELDPAHLAELRTTYFAELDKHVEPKDRSAIVVDKMPLNAAEAGLIQRIFPRARFLFVLRHPCDCVLSCFMQNFKVNHAMANFLDLEDAARLYDKVMTLWQQYQAVLPLAVHTVRYEDLVETFEETLAPVFDFLGVDWDDGVQNYIETAQRRRIINTPSYNQVTQPLYTRARGRWERYHEQMQPVLPTLLPWARHFGYEEQE